ncbi:hypothetical protein FSP39_002983 [Pinctada imbricata]|uniref:TIR domain-containing protein n=1 Tax=Pinctada imbricata TaxID=66713 RepID=A0AA89BYH3_PINIB|nr:hypothetical protein FSP39_002983 [Pinctada imbricata]
MPGVILSKEQTQMLQNTSLKILSLDANQIQHVELDSVMTLPKSLVNLSVQANEFGRSAFLTLSAIFQLPNLEQIDFSYQCSNYQAFEFGRRQKRFIEDNKSGPRPERLEDLCYSSFKVKNFALSPSLRSVISKETEITKCIPAIEFQENSVERVYLSKSSLYAWKGPITMKGTPNLTVVDLSDNNCRKVSRNFFDYGFTIEILLLAGNNLGLTFALTQNNRIFQNLTRLRILDVSRNNIEELDAAFLKDQIMLEHLSFSKNYLKSFTLSIEHMNKLKHLDLSHNRIIVVSNVLISKQDFGNAFSVLQQNGTLDIRANPLECTCRGILFWQWAQETKIRILYNINLTCMLDNGQDIVVTNLLRNLKQIDGSCKSKLLLIILMVVLILTILSFCVAFIYRYRWEIRYRWFLFKLKRKGYERIAETEDDFKYDVFLSYADEDGSYVHRNIMPYLESEKNLRVCLHERDFTPGESITSNILRAVHGSQRTLAIVSPKYIESHWCMFEFRMASVEQAFGDRKVIVVALLQNLTVSNIPPEVMHYLRTNSYIELPKEGIDTDDQHAWSALLTSITT